LVLDTPENLPTKGLKRSKSLNNVRSFHTANLVPCKYGSCPREKVLLLGDFEDAPLLLVHLTLTRVESTGS
jgi:hypothetical protein